MINGYALRENGGLDRSVKLLQTRPTAMLRTAIDFLVERFG
ncbi:hypothetical protein [Rhizobium lentis]|nr:hypothetical protein [Rhizobium lentis]